MSWLGIQTIPLSTAYLKLSWVKDVMAVIVADVGEHLITLTSNGVPIRCVEELVTGSKQRHIVGAADKVSHSVGHGGRGK